MNEAAAAFARDGFVVVEGLLTDAELDHFAPLVTDAVHQRADADTRPLAERTPYQQSFQQCINLWEDFPAIRPLTFHPRVAQTASRLLGVDTLRLWHDQALYKWAGGRETDPHQDQPYWPIAETTTITAWIPLDGSTMENGAMGYLPGSHRVGLHKFQNIFTAEDADALLNRPEIADIAPVYVEVPRGAVAYHAGLTVHMAKPNTTDTDRPVHTVIMFADGCTRSAAHFHPSVDRDGIAVGAPIAGACTPIVWPRADDEYPVPPPPFPEPILELAPTGVFPRTTARGSPTES
jgi:ectoine hydroxylase-related dioxygenase (phytanoyl-CoA dioxygenase family)